MGDRSAIEWTDATWNPIRGCSRVSEGCRHCYAESVASRFSGPGKPYEGLARKGKWTGEVRLIEEALNLPLRWRTPRRVFVNSMSDLFHEKVPDEWLVRIFNIMWSADRHTFQVLTKRPERMRDFMAGGLKAHGVWCPTWPPPNVWIGVSVEDQKAADERIPLLLQTPAALRFLSVEPLLGPVDIAWSLHGDFSDNGKGRGIHWIIVGGESGPGARPCDIGCIRFIIDDCRTAKVPVFVKQLGARSIGWHAYPATAHLGPHGALRFIDRKGGEPAEWPEDLRVREFPK